MAGPAPRDREEGEDQAALCFGTMRLLRSSRLLLEGDRPLRLGERAFDLLVALVEGGGQVLSKNELVARVWPRTVVKETSLRVHIGALRKVLGDGKGGVRYVVNVPVRGYAFIAPVHTASQAEAARAPAPAPAQAPVPAARQRLPAQLNRMIGRESDTDAAVDLLRSRRFVTLVGPGGIGKTTLALAVARRLLGVLRDGAVFVDLTLVADEAAVLNAIGTALGVAVHPQSDERSLADHLHDRQMLLVLDNCEHVVAIAARVVSSLLKTAHSLHVLATSREPLRADGENVRRLQPLDAPPAAAHPSAAEAMQYPAVELLVERVTSSLDGFVLDDEDAAVAGELCRRLDGNPLAIELAAVRVGFFGLRELLARLDDRLRILSNGERTALPRHQTLGALHAWSHNLLPETGRIALRRLSVFPGMFTLEDAVAVVGDAGDQPLEVEDAVIDLVAKSLVSADQSGDAMRYRLLHTTRMYAAQQLADAGEEEAMRRRHAEHLHRLLAKANPEWEQAHRAQWLRRYGYLIDDVRAALDWCHRQPDQAPLGASLMQVAYQLVQQLSLFEEFRPRMEAALEGLATAEVADPRLEMELNVSLSAALGQIHPPMVRRDDVIRPVQRAERAAQALQDGTSSHVFYARWVTSFGHGDYPTSLAAARNLERSSRQAHDEQGVLIGQRMLAQTWHFLGDHERSRQYADTVLRSPARALRVGGKMLDPVDRRMSMRIILARVHWMEGDLDGAQRLADEALALAQAEDDMAYVECQLLGMTACPLAIWAGDTAKAEALVAQLHGVAKRHALGYWCTWAQAFAMVLEGRLDIGACEPGAKLGDMLITMDDRAADAAALNRVESEQVGWCAPELHRAAAEAKLRGRRPDLAAAEQHLMQALAIARAQQAPFWELRAALALHRLRFRQQRDAEGLAVLQAAYAQFPPDVRSGAQAADLRTARSYLGLDEAVPGAWGHRSAA